LISHRQEEIISCFKENIIIIKMLMNSGILFLLGW